MGHHGNFELFADMARYVGKTVTIFTASGGISGSGFTGVLACVDDRVVKLITRIGAPPACPVGSTCGGFDGFGGWGGCGRGGCGGFLGGGWGGFGGGFSNFLGSVTEIPLCAIVSFTHSAI
ncbi:MAG: hypothetical protein FWC69_02630 [Defluviitaleaceae bacterium]|nr:hypothetical protein [Defluviitaleaceae bacterium]